MKNYITIALILFSILGFAQDDKNVKKNNEKIGELNERLDNLINGSSKIEGDSINIKIDQLISDIKEIKSEIQVLKKTVNQINEQGIVTKSNDNGSSKELETIESKLNELDNGVYYVILASAKIRGNGQRRLNNMSKAGLNLKLVQNERETWYHIILDQEFSLAEAIKRTNELKRSAYLDAWFMTGRKLK